jgi:hypothetical protein
MTAPLLERALQLLDARGPDGRRRTPTAEQEQALSWLALTGYGMGDGPPGLTRRILDLFEQAQITAATSVPDARRLLAARWQAAPIAPELWEGLTQLAKEEPRS